MSIWTKLIKEYFCRHDKGTAINVLDWIANNKYSEIETYAEQVYKNCKIKYPYLKNPYGGVQPIIKGMLRIENVSPVLSRIHKANKLQRKETMFSPCKWEYFYPEKEVSGNSYHD